MKIKHDPDSVAHPAALPHPSEPGQSPPASLLLSSLTTALSKLSGAGEHTIHDRQSERRARASERATPLLCHCAVLKGTHIIEADIR